MTKKEIQRIMAIVRPAIIALYGRQPLKLVRYRDRLACQGHPRKSMLLTVRGRNGIYNVEFEIGRVTVLEIANEPT